MMTSKHTAPKHTLTDDFFSVCNWKDYILPEEFISCFCLANELSLLSVLLKLYRSVCLKEAYQSNLASALSNRKLTHSDLICGGFLTRHGVCPEAELFDALSSAVSTWWSTAGWSVNQGNSKWLGNLKHFSLHHLCMMGNTPPNWVSVLWQISFVAESHCVHVTSKMQLFLLSFLLPLG